MIQRWYPADTIARGGGGGGGVGWALGKRREYLVEFSRRSSGRWSGISASVRILLGEEERVPGPLSLSILLSCLLKFPV